MQTKNEKKLDNDYSMNGDEDLNTTNRIHVVLPSAIIALSSVVPFIVLFVFTYLIAVFGKNEFPVEAGLRILSVGFIHILISIIASILWLRNIKWIRYILMLLAIINTLSLILISLFQWLFVALILDAYLFWALFLINNRNET